MGKRGVDWRDRAHRIPSGPVSSSGEEPGASVDGPVATPVGVGSKVGDYLLLEELGRGGTATVYRAKHPQAAAECAVKVLHSRFAGSARLRRRLAREVRILADLAHPNLVGILDSGGPPEAPPYLVTELAMGPTLAKVIAEVTPLSTEQVAEILAQVARGLAAAHRAGIVHRDLKPANVVLTRIRGETRAKVLDFGLARALEEELHGTAFTSMNDLLGTPAYMSPEQIRDPSRVGPRTDLYSLGLIGYELLTGQRPTFRPTHKLELLEADLRVPPLEGKGPVGALIMHLLEVEAERRPNDAMAVVKTLEELRLPPTDLGATIGDEVPSGPQAIPGPPPVPPASFSPDSSSPDSSPPESSSPDPSSPGVRPEATKILPEPLAPPARAKPSLTEPLVQVIGPVPWRPWRIIGVGALVLALVIAWAWNRRRSVPIPVTPSSIAPVSPGSNSH